MLPKITIDFSKINGKCHSGVEILVNGEQLYGVIRIDNISVGDANNLHEMTITLLTDDIKVIDKNGTVEDIRSKWQVVK